jgi:hypothetical protein
MIIELIECLLPATTNNYNTFTNVHNLELTTDANNCKFLLLFAWLQLLTLEIRFTGSVLIGSCPRWLAPC